MASPNNPSDESDISDVSCKMWANDVIWHEITSYLNISDLKVLCHVNKYFKERVRRLSRFTSRSGQTVSGSMNINVFKLSKAVVEVNRLKEQFLEDLAVETFRDTEYLELQRLGRMSDETRNLRLIKIVSNCTKLKSLAFGTKNFFGKNYKVFLTNDSVKSILSNLKELHIGISNKEYDDEDSDEEGENSDDDEGYTLYAGREDDTDTVTTFSLFPDLQLKLRKHSYIEPDEAVFSNFSPDTSLGSSQQTLVELSLSIHVTGLDKLSALKLPKLSVLHLEVFGSYDEDNEDEDYTDMFCAKLIPFLKNHVGTLVQFKFHSLCEYSLVPFSSILKSATKLKILKLRSQTSFSKTLRTINWGFLGSMPALSTFKISMDDSNDYSDDEANDYLDEEEDDEPEGPAEIRRSARSDNWDRYLIALPSTITSVGFKDFYFSGRPEDLSNTVATSLTRFQNLTQLLMVGCKDFLTDDTLQFVCKSLEKLQVLKGEFRSVSDFGVTGRGQDGTDSGVSLRNLKGLTKLALHCGGHKYGFNITWNGLLNSVVFTNLVKLSVNGKLADAFNDCDQDDSKDGHNYLKLIRQNPCLEHIKLSFYTPKRWFRRETSIANPRVKLPPEYYSVSMNDWSPVGDDHYRFLNC